MSDAMAAEEDPPMDDERAPDQIADEILDGNAVAGMLMAAFGTEMTAVPGRCAHCGTMNVVASLRAYTRAPGAILRCPVCAGVVIRIVETADATLVDARGASYLRFERR
jgi:hypothetical protein